VRICCAFACSIMLNTMSATAQHATFVLPETGNVMTVRLSNPDPDQRGFRSLDFVNTRSTAHFTPNNPMACIPNDAQARLETGLWQQISGTQLDNSRCFFRGLYTAGSRRHTLLFFISEGYASNASPILIIGFTADGKPYKVLERDELDVTSFQTTDQNDALIIGKPTLTEVMFGDGGNGSKSPYATSYDPFAVYVVREGEPAKFSLLETKRYNLQHYVWHGPAMSEDWAVVFNLRGHPKRFLAPVSKLDAFFQKSSTQKHP